MEVIKTNEKKPRRLEKVYKRLSLEASVAPRDEVLTALQKAFNKKDDLVVDLKTGETFKVSKTYMSAWASEIQNEKDYSSFFDFEDTLWADHGHNLTPGLDHTGTMYAIFVGLKNGHNRNLVSLLPRVLGSLKSKQEVDEFDGVVIGTKAIIWRGSEAQTEEDSQKE